MLFGELVQRAWQETSCRDLVQRPGEENRDLAQRYFTTNLSGDLTLRSLTLFWLPCTGTLHRDLLQKSCQEVSCINIAKRALIESLYKDLIMMYCQRISKRYIARGLAKRRLIGRYLAHRALFGILCRNLARRPLIEILCRDLVKRAEVSLRDLFIDSLNRDLTLRSLTKIFCRDPFIDTLYG